MPTSMMAIIRSEVPTGRRMKMREGFMRPPAWLARACSSAAWGVPRLALAAALPLSRSGVLGAACPRRGGRRVLPQLDLGAVLELVGAVHHHSFPGRKPLCDRHVGGIARTQGHFAHADRLVGTVDEVDIGARCATLHPCLRDEGRAVQRVAPG